MFSIKRLSIISLLISFLILLLPLISAQEEQEKQQEVTEEFFYAEEEVEIASLKPQAIEEAPGIVSIVTAQQIKDMGARDLNDALRIVPGFQLPVSLFYASEYAVRGLKQTNNTRVLVMMDGVPLNEVYYGQSNLNWGDMPLNNVKKIEIIRGPGSALYGTYAFLAVINIITNKAEDIDGIEFSVGGGSWNTQHHYLSAGKKIGDISLSAYVDYRKSDGYDHYFVQQDLVNILDSYVPFFPPVSQAPGNVKVPLDSKRVDVRMGYHDFDFQFKAQDYKRGVPFPGFSVTEGNFEADKSYISQVAYQKNISNKLSLYMKGNYYYRKLLLYGQPFPRGIYGPLLPGMSAQGFFPDGLLFDLTVKSQHYGLNTKFDYTLSKDNMITFGIEYSFMKTDRPIGRDNIDPVTRMQSNQMHEERSAIAGVMEKDANRKVIALFIQDVFNIGDSLDITAGLRLDHYSEFGSAVNPRISLVWKPSEDTNIKILYGHSFRAPAFTELYNITQDMVGNENLSPEKVRSFEIGINHKLTPKINGSINYFYNSLTDIFLPTGDIIIESFPPQLENSGKVNAQGIEAEVKANFEKNTYAFFNYSYAKAKDDLTGEVIPDVANHLFNFGVNIDAWKYLNANLNVNYVGERKRGLLMGFPDPRDPIAPYALSNLTLRAQNFWENTEVILSIHNLFDKQYADPESLGLIYYDFPREGRQILAKVIFKF
jgi:outer membrane receptor for ferrienterochelin and colicins